MFGVERGDEGFHNEMCLKQNEVVWIWYILARTISVI